MRSARRFRRFAAGAAGAAALVLTVAGPTQAAFSSVIITGTTVTVSWDAGADAIVVTCASGGALTFTDGSISSTAGDCATLTALTINAGGGADTVDLTGIDPAAVPALAALVVNGEAGDDTIRPSGVADTIDGGAGSDTLDYSASAASVIVDLGTPFLSGGNASGDSVAPFTIENVNGTAAADVLTGDASANTITGLAGADVIGGGAGSDTILGGAGNDTVSGGNGSDTVAGDAGNDTLGGDSQSDTLDGGLHDDVFTYAAGSGASGDDTISDPSGDDRVDFSASTAGITFSLAVASAQPFAAGESLALGSAAIEDLAGSPLDDTLVGSALNNDVNGGAGSDTYRGLFVGTDTLSDSSGTADLLDFSELSFGVTFSLFDFTPQSLGGANTLQVTNDFTIENLIGTAYDDTLRGNGLGNSISAGAGNDTVEGDLGDDTLAGGAGTDTASYSTAPGFVTVSLAVVGPQFTTNAWTDTLSAFENLEGSAFNDALNGDANVNVIDGLSGADAISGAGGADTLNGGAGPDAISSEGADTVDGGTENDSIGATLGVIGGTVTIDGGAGTDSLDVQGSAVTDIVTTTASTISTPTETVSYSAVESVSLNTAGGADDITVNGTSTTILGGGDDDTFTVNAVGPGGVMLDGLADSDTYTVNFGAIGGVVTISDNGSSGVDEVSVSCAGTALAFGTAINGTQTVNYSGIEVPPSCGNTPVGSPVTVTMGNVSVTFSSVTTDGNTLTTTSSTGPTPPAGYSLGSPPVYYEIATTAVYTPPVTVCIDYTGLGFAATPTLFHYETPPGAWVDVTTSVDTVNEIVCGVVSSLSPFALGVPAYGMQVLTDLSKAKQRGSTIPVKLRVLDASGAAVTSVAVTALDVDGTALPAGAFKVTGDGYHFNLKTTGLAAGTHVLHVSVAGAVHAIPFTIK